MLREITRLKGSGNDSSQTTPTPTLDTMLQAMDRMRKYGLRRPPELRYIRQSTLDAIRECGTSVSRVSPSTYFIHEPDREEWLAVIVTDEYWDELFPRDAE